jgi:hypothetical protein
LIKTRLIFLLLIASLLAFALAQFGINSGCGMSSGGGF